MYDSLDYITYIRSKIIQINMYKIVIQIKNQHHPAEYMYEMNRLADSLVWVFWTNSILVFDINMLATILNYRSGHTKRPFFYPIGF